MTAAWLIAMAVGMGGRGMGGAGMVQALHRGKAEAGAALWAGEGRACNLSMQGEMLSMLSENNDGSTSPCKNFYQHSCGSWLGTHDIPGDRSSWGTFSILALENKEAVRDILEKDEGKPGKFYASCMDTKGIDEADSDPMINLMNKTRISFGSSGSAEWTARDFEDLSDDMAKLYMIRIEPFWSLGVSTDPKDSDKHEIGISQGGLSLPRTTMSSDTEASKKKRELLKVHIVRSFDLLDKSCDAACAEGIVGLEQNLANIMLTETEMRDPIATYNKMHVASFSANKTFPWKKYIGKIYGSKKPVEYVDVATPDYMNQVEKVLRSTPKAFVRQYVRWNMLSGHMSHLSQPFRDEIFNMSKALNGVSKQPARWEICTSRTEGAFPDLVSRDFVKNHFSPESRKIAKNMIKHIKKAFLANLQTNDWMDQKTKAEAARKCTAIREKVGYPDYIFNQSYLEEQYRDIQVEDHGRRYFDNHMSAVRASVQKDIAEWGKPVDREVWGMTAPTVNAYYDPTKNEIVFPAGILRKPFFVKDYHMAFNFGAVGVVMGHELTHGFDDQGALYDEKGNMRSWWMKETKSKFDERTGCLADQYSKFTVQGENGANISINGRLTLGENTADNGGARLALRAYRTYQEEFGDASCSGDTTDLFEKLFKNDDQLAACGKKLSAEQLYFYGFAQVWCTNARPSSIEQQVNLDPHSPAEWRVRGTVGNMDEFEKAFCCRTGKTKEKCQVW